MRSPARTRPAPTSGARLPRRALRPDRIRLLVVPSGSLRNCGDLLVGQVFEKGQGKRLALRKGQGLHGRSHDGPAMLAPDRLGGVGAWVGDYHHGRSRQTTSSRGASGRGDAVH